MYVLVECVICVFLFGFNFMLWIVEFIGMLCIGNVLLGLIGVLILDWIELFVFKFLGVIM